MYPFMRNHNVDTGRDQEFYALGPKVMETARKNLKLRYAILKHFYTLFIKNNGAGTFWRPLFFNFPNDTRCYADEVMDKQFMIGEELLVTPNVQESSDLINPYFPPGGWNDLLTGFRIQRERQNGGNHLVYNPLNDVVPIFIRAGKIVPFQQKRKVQNIKDLDNTFVLITSLSWLREKYVEYDAYAEGQLLNLADYTDDAKIANECVGPDRDCIAKVFVGLKGDKLTVKIESDSKIADNIVISKIRLYNVDENELPQQDMAKHDHIGEYMYVRVLPVNWKLADKAELEISLSE
jgi:alpha-glucosidase/lysosomal alpha-glucosidase